MALISEGQFEDPCSLPAGDKRSDPECDYDSEEDEDDSWELEYDDWQNERGDFSKKLNAIRSGNPGVKPNTKQKQNINGSTKTSSIPLQHKSILVRCHLK